MNSLLAGRTEFNDLISSVCLSLGEIPVEATCEQEIYNNITYFVSPGFPALLPNDKPSCKVKVKVLNSDISQIRFDFVHFTLVNICFVI